MDLASSDCLLDSSGTVLCLILNELSKKGMFHWRKKLVLEDI